MNGLVIAEIPHPVPARVGDARAHVDVSCVIPDDAGDYDDDDEEQTAAAAGAEKAPTEEESATATSAAATAGEAAFSLCVTLFKPMRLLNVFEASTQLPPTSVPACPAVPHDGTGALPNQQPAVGAATTSAATNANAGGKVEVKKCGEIARRWRQTRQQAVARGPDAAERDAHSGHAMTVAYIDAYVEVDMLCGGPSPSDEGCDEAANSLQISWRVWPSK